jgi:hypothetical protein
VRIDQFQGRELAGADQFCHFEEGEAVGHQVYSRVPVEVR